MIELIGYGTKNKSERAELHSNGTEDSYCASTDEREGVGIS